MNLNKKNLLVAAFSLLTIFDVSAQDACYSRLNGDTLTMGTGVIERKFLWNEGNLVTLSVTNRESGQTLLASSKNPDCSIINTSAQKVTAEYNVTKEPSDGIRPAFLQVVVTSKTSSLFMKRVYTLYNRASAILCDTYLKAVSSEKHSDGTNGLLVNTPVLEALNLSGKHWHVKTVGFIDATDNYNNLVEESSYIPYKTEKYRGNLFIAQDGISGNGFFFLKEAPNGASQVEYPGYDFSATQGNFNVYGLGLSEKDLNATEWTRAYGCVLGVWAGEEVNALLALRHYLKNERMLVADRDEMIMANTWGDRGQDLRINESFCLAELENCARMGVTYFQLDDGWQAGKSPNSAMVQGSFKDIWKNPFYWTPDSVKFPHGLSPVVKRAKELGIKVGLWFNPSIQNDLADWEKDAEALVKLNKQYGIEVFKIDGLELPTKRAETHLRQLFDKVIKECGSNVVFNLDVTAGRRAGFFMMSKYGNLFLENRYTDWGNYYPYQTLRNLWQLSKYVPAEKLQIEFLNKWRNAKIYPAGDIFSPANYSFDYLFAITMAAQPLVWLEMGNLPQEAYTTGAIIKKYRTIQHQFHEGVILPIGETPSGRAWTGFQSIGKEQKEGFLIFYRENNEQEQGMLKTYLPANRKVVLEPVLGNGKRAVVSTSCDGTIPVMLKQKNDFVLYKYTVK